MKDGKLLTIERRSLLTQNDTLFFNLSRVTQRSYQLEFVPEGMDQGLTAFLEDSYLKTRTPVDISQTSVSSFTITADAGSSAANRFRIVFRPSAPLPVTFVTIKAIRQNENINVEWKTENELNIKQYDVERSVDGNTFTETATVTASGHSTYSWLDKDASSNVVCYRIKSIDVNGDTKYSTIAKVNILNNELGEITIYPNPVVNSKIGLQMNNMPSGKYYCKLINSLGQVIFTTALDHTSANARETLSPENKITKGIYKLEITGTDKKSTVLNVLVE